MSPVGSGRHRWPVSRKRTRLALIIRSTTSRRRLMAYSWSATRMTEYKTGSAATRNSDSPPNSRPCVRNLGPRLEGAGSPVVAVVNRAIPVAMVRVVAGGRVPLRPPAWVEGLARAPVISDERPGRVVGASGGRGAHTSESETGGHHDRCGGETRDCVHAKTVPERPEKHCREFGTRD